MSYIDAIDISNYQGAVDFAQVPQPIVVMKASEGVSYLDPYLFRNYDEAKHKHGKAVGMYHFARGGDPVAEANWFINCCQPLEQYDVFVLDWEIQHPDPVGWCQAFVNRVHDLTGTWPLIYMNGSTLNSYDWSPVRNNCGTWVAWYDRDPNEDLPVSGTYVMHQYTSSGSVPGIGGRVDLDAVYMSVDQFRKYGYQAGDPAPVPQPAPIPAPAPDPVPPAPTPDPAPSPDPEPTPVPPQPTPAPIPSPTPPNGIKPIIAAIIAAFAALIGAFLAWINS